MPKKILVAVDLSKMSDKIVTYGCTLSQRLDVNTSFIHVLPHPTLWKGYEPWLPPEMDTEVSEIARKKINYYIHKAQEAMPKLLDRKYEVIIEEGNPSDVIIRKAKEGDFNLIIIGYRGQSAIERLVVGSTATNVARYAHCSVLIFRPGLDVF